MRRLLLAIAFTWACSGRLVPPPATKGPTPSFDVDVTVAQPQAGRWLVSYALKTPVDAEIATYAKKPEKAYQLFVFFTDGGVLLYTGLAPVARSPLARVSSRFVLAKPAASFARTT